MNRNKKDRERVLDAADVMKVLSHPVRLSILCDLLHEGRMGAGDIVERQAGRASQSQISQYLADFRERGYVRAEKIGQNVYYTFRSPLIEQIIALLYKEFCGRKV